MLAAAILSISVWHGHALPTSTAAATKYRVAIVSTAGSRVHLTVTGVERGWIGAFCDNRVCSPNQITEVVPSGGTAVVQFELIREDEGAAHRSAAVIRGDDGATVRVPAASQ